MFPLNFFPGFAGVWLVASSCFDSLLRVLADEYNVLAKQWSCCFRTKQCIRGLINPDADFAVFENNFRIRRTHAYD
jgi:hypothetical protein